MALHRHDEVVLLLGAPGATRLGTPPGSVITNGTPTTPEATSPKPASMHTPQSWKR